MFIMYINMRVVEEKTHGFTTGRENYHAGQCQF
jgi:hypothetical protein